jgi:hypothetical protein
MSVGNLRGRDLGGRQRRHPLQPVLDVDQCASADFDRLEDSITQKLVRDGAAQP